MRPNQTINGATATGANGNQVNNLHSIEGQTYLGYLPRENSNSLMRYPPSYSHYEMVPIPYHPQTPYEVSLKIGFGKYSDVFEGFCTCTEQPVVIKVLKPVRRRKIFREIKILTSLAGGPNCVQLLDVVMVSGSLYPALITEHCGPSLQTLQAQNQNQFSQDDIRIIILETLRALDWCHSHGIIHRDVKPGNICCNPTTGQLKLLDFGLAEFYQPDVPLHCRVASRHFKGPELLVNYQTYDYSLDIWSLGCMLAGFIFKRNPFFHGTTNYNQLDKIVSILGSDDFFRYIEKYRIPLSKARIKDLSSFQKVNFEAFTDAKNEALVTPDAISFLKWCLHYDPQERPTVREAMQHPYFDPVRERVAQRALRNIRKRCADAELLKKCEIEAGKRAEYAVAGVLGLTTAGLPSWRIDEAETDSKTDITGAEKLDSLTKIEEEALFPVPASPKFIGTFSTESTNPGSVSQELADAEKEWRDYWIGMQKDLLKRGGEVYTRDKLLDAKANPNKYDIPYILNPTSVDRDQ